MTRLSIPDPAALPALLADFPPSPMVGMLALSPSTAELFVRQAMAQFSGLELPARDRELVTLAVAALTECAFVTAEHGPMSEKAGITEEERALIARRDFDAFSGRDAALLRFAVRVVDQPRVPDELFACTRSFFSDREIVEILQVCGYYWTFCRIATVLDVSETS